MANIGQFLSTIGLELELDIVSQEQAKACAKSAKVSDKIIVTRDGSVESEYVNFGPLVVVNNTNLTAGSLPKVLGSEVYTIPLEVPELESALEAFLNQVKLCGETEQSSRSSVHVHVGFTQNFYYIQNLLRFGVGLESLFYRIGGMGYTNRVLENNAAYCRPLTTEFAAPIVKTERGDYVRLFNSIYDVINAKNLQEMWYRFGLHGNAGGENKHVPSRYFGVNIMSILLHGTAEFRFFNKSLSPRKLAAVAKLCQTVTELCTTVRAEEITNNLPESSVYEKRDPDTEHIILEKLLRLSENHSVQFPMRDVDTLHSIIMDSQQIVLPKKNVLTHLVKQYSLEMYFLDDYEREKISPKDTITCGNIDIHNFRGSNYSLLREVMR